MSSPKNTKIEKIPSSAGNKNLSRFDKSLTKLLLLSTIIGVVIAGYILIIVRVEQGRKIEDPLEVAAKLAARELSKITETHPRFGFVGLTDTELKEDVAYAMHPPVVRSVNSLTASMHTLAQLQELLNSKIISNLLESDLTTLEKVEEALRTKLLNSVAKESSKGDNTVYKKIYSFLNDSIPSDSTLVDLKISIGSFGDDTSKATFINAPESESAKPYVENGFYKDNILIPIADRHHIRFYKISNERKIVPADKFHTIGPGEFPTAVLLELTLKDSSKEETKTTQKKICSLIGNDEIYPYPSCLALRFPQGIPEKYNSLDKLLNQDLEVNGHWLESFKGDVPGKGELSPTFDPVLNVMTPRRAILTGIYDWVLSISPAPDAQRIKDVLQVNYLSYVSKSKQFNVFDRKINSCIAVDTGARERAFLKATEKNGTGQFGLARCFEYPLNIKEFPSASIPVIVDKTGNAKIAGRSIFNESLIQNYLDSLYATNLSAIETMATARIITKRYQAKKIIARKTSNKDAQLYGDIAQAARIAGKNGLKVATKTYEIASMNFNLLRNGLYHINEPLPAYLINRQFIFQPIDTPLTEEDLLIALEENRLTNSKEPKLRWLDPGLTILTPWKSHFKTTAGVKIEGRPLDQVLAEKPSALPYKPMTIIFDSRDIQSEGELIPHISLNYPFKSQPIHEKQSVFYAKHAYLTGKDPKVIWSLLVKDNTFHQNVDKRGTRDYFRNRIWCNQFDPPLFNSPRLSAEVQLRRPLPVLKNIPHSIVLTDPRFERTQPLVPPVPAELM